MALRWAVIVQQDGRSSSGCGTALGSALQQSSVRCAGCGNALASALQQYNVFYVAIYCDVVRSGGAFLAVGCGVCAVVVGGWIASVGGGGGGWYSASIMDTTMLRVFIW